MLGVAAAAVAGGLIYKMTQSKEAIIQPKVSDLTTKVKKPKVTVVEQEDDNEDDVDDNDTTANPAAEAESSDENEEHLEEEELQFNKRRDEFREELVKKLNSQTFETEEVHGVSTGIIL